MLHALLWTFAVANLVYGALALLDAERVARWVGLRPVTTAANGEIRAVYGGLVFAFGVMAVVGLRRPEGWVVIEALGIAFAGLTLGRVASLALDGFTRWNWSLLLVEGLAAGFLLWAAPELAAGG